MRIAALSCAPVLTGCSGPVAPPDPSPDSGIPTPPRNQDNTEGGLCCQITYNFHDEPFWNDRRYRCLGPDEPAEPFNPPFVCNVTFEGECGGDTGLTCRTCFDPDCVVGSRCRDVNGTGTVLPCR